MDYEFVAFYADFFPPCVCFRSQGFAVALQNVLFAEVFS